MSSVVVHRAAEYLDLMSSLTHPDDLYFWSFTTSPDIPGVADLCHTATRVATGNKHSAMASLVIVPGDEDAFRVSGTHAEATLGLRHTSPDWRLIVPLVLLVLLLVGLLLTRKTS